MVEQPGSAVQSQLERARMCRKVRSFLSVLALGLFSRPVNMKTCEPIAVDLCRGIGYNFTGMPNRVGHEIQADADFTLQTFSPLVQYGCSAQLNFFLCSVYVPMCNEKVSTPIGPCRRLCESVRSRCYPVLQGFGFPWPTALDCSKFPPENDHQHMCMEGPGEIGLGIVAARPATNRMQKIHVHDIIPVRGHVETPCAKYARPNFYVYINRTQSCAQTCDADLLFGKTDKDLAEVWLTVWAGLCFAATLFAMMTFIVDSGSRNSRSLYPERPLPFLALCYNIVSIGWGLRAGIGHDAVACYPDPQEPDVLLLSQDGLGNANCTLVFLLIYYFGNAASVWWVVLATCWFLSSGLDWTNERIAHHSPLFHLASWGLPAAQTIAVLILRHVDADELTGTCLVGNQNTSSLLWFVLIPQFFYLVLSVSMLLLGFMLSLRSQKTCSSGQANSSWRIGILSPLYSLPTACIIASLLYEYWNREDWLLSTAPSPVPRLQPHAFLWVFLLRFFMSLVLGVIVALWICSPKSIQAWKFIFWPFETHKKQPQFQFQQNIHYYHQPQHQKRIKKHRTHRNKRGNETLV